MCHTLSGCPDATRRAIAHGTRHGPARTVPPLAHSHDAFRAAVAGSTAATQTRCAELRRASARARGARPNGGGRGGFLSVPQSNSPDRTTSSPGCHLVEPPLRAGRDEREASETEREMEEEAELMMMTTTTTRRMMVMMMPSMFKQRQRQVVLLTPAAPCRTMGGRGGEALPSARCRASSFDRRMPRRLLTPRHALPVGWLPAACASRSQHAHLMSVGRNSARRRRRAWSSMTLHEMTCHAMP